MEDFVADARGAYSSPFEEVCEILQFKQNLESKILKRKREII